MASSPREDRLILHITGMDRPGVTSTVTSILAREGARLLDLGQSVLLGYLNLSLVVEVPPGSDALRQTLFAVADLGLRFEVEPFGKRTRSHTSNASGGLSVLLLGELTQGHVVAAATGLMAEKGLNILELKTLAGQEIHGLELLAELPAGAEARDPNYFSTLRSNFLDLATKYSADVALQRDDIYRRNKRLVCMDVDSTFIQMEVIDELAKLAGAGEKVAAITERAMRGELDFRQALHERVASLKGLPFEKAKGLLEKVPLTPGAETLVRTLKDLGFHVGLVSGGFDFFVDELKRRFGLDFAFANQLEVRDGLLTGKVSGSIVDAERKAQLLRDMAQVYRCRLEQTVAIGDGANDRLMLQEAGLGIAFHAKPKLQEVAHASFNRNWLDSVLYLMGLHHAG